MVLTLNPQYQIWEKSQNLKKNGHKTKKFTFPKAKTFGVKKLGVVAQVNEPPEARSENSTQNLRYGRAVYKKFQKNAKINILTFQKAITFCVKLFVSVR